MRVVGGLTEKQQQVLKHFSERTIDCTNEEISVIGNSNREMTSGQLK